MFAHPQTIQLHHIDAYGILFFANQLAFCHDAFQAWLAANGRPLAPTRGEAEYIAVMVRVESEYRAPVRLGDRLNVVYTVAAVGTTSFTNRYLLVNPAGTVVGEVRTVQVTIDPATSAKMPIPAWLRALLVANAEAGADIRAA